MLLAGAMDQAGSLLVLCVGPGDLRHRLGLYAFREQDRAVMLSSTGDPEPIVNDIYGESPIVPGIGMHAERTMPVAQD